MATIDEQMGRVHNIADTSFVIGRGSMPSPGVKETELNAPDLTIDDNDKNSSKETPSLITRLLTKFFPRR